LPPLRRLLYFDFSWGIVVVCDGEVISLLLFSLHFFFIIFFLHSPSLFAHLLIWHNIAHAMSYSKFKTFGIKTFLSKRRDFNLPIIFGE
jgi:hypothetical protein